MSDKVPVNRPPAVTAICSLLFALGIFNIIYTFTGVYAPFGVYYSAVNALMMVIMFAALSGIWVMEKWGVYLFTVLVIIKVCIDLYSGAFRWMEILLLVPVVMFLLQLKKMN